MLYNILFFFLTFFLIYCPVWSNVPISLCLSNGKSIFEFGKCSDQYPDSIFLPYQEDYSQYDYTEFEMPYSTELCGQDDDIYLELSYTSGGLNIVNALGFDKHGIIGTANDIEIHYLYPFNMDYFIPDATCIPPEGIFNNVPVKQGASFYTQFQRLVPENYFSSGTLSTQGISSIF